MRTNVYISSNGGDNAMYDPTKIKFKRSYPLMGLSHLGIQASIYETDQNAETPNLLATEILQYLTSPSLIYTDIGIYGDILLSLESEEKILSLQVFTLISNIVQLKKLGNIPPLLLRFIERVIEVKTLKLSEASDKEKIIIQHEIEHIKYNLGNYGKLVKYEDLVNTYVGSVQQEQQQ